MEECIFCRIIKENLPSKTIYEDNLVKVIMNIDPATNGHLLVLPKQHYINILDIPEEVVCHIFKIIRDILYPILRDKLHCEGLTISENNFLGQEIKHFHIHLIPRYQNDLVNYKYNKEILINIDDLYSKLIEG